MRNIKISVCRLSVRSDAVKFYETVFYIWLCAHLALSLKKIGCGSG